MTEIESIRLERSALLIGTILGQISELLNTISKGQTNENYIYCSLLDIQKMASLQVHELYYKNNNPPENPILKKDISDHDIALTVRTVNCLRAEKINTIGELVEWSAYKLIRTPNLGAKSLKEIENALRQLGLSLKGTP